MSQSQVLIVGAGPSGLILALTLLRNRVSVRIIEKNETIPPGQRGSAISPRTLELYKILGILPEVERQSTSAPVTMKVYQSPEGDAPIKEGPFLESVGNQPEYYRVNAIFLGQDDHMKTLVNILDRDYGVSVEYGTELTSFENHDSHITAHISKGGQMEAARFFWIVGAEGSRSVVRKQAGLTFLGDTFAGTTLVIGDIEVTKGPEEEQVVARMWGNYGDRLLFLRPYKREGKNYYWFALGGAKLDSAKAASGRDGLLESFYDIIGKRYIEFGDLRNLAPWTANVRMVDKFSQGRAFVVGDAAHVHSPTGGQGLTSGVQDSINLGWKLALVMRGLAPHDLLDSFSSERLPIIATMLDKTTELMNKTFQKSSENNVGWTHDWELKQFGINYRGSSLLVDERYTDSNGPFDPYRSGHDGSSRAGDRAPFAPSLIPSGGGKTCGLYDLLGIESHTVLVFSRPGTSLADEVQGTLSGYDRELVKSLAILPQGTSSSEVLSLQSFIDSEGYAYKHYKVSQDEELVVVVRPDGYIGAVANGTSGLQNYFSKIFL
ncbi:hypothetical protein AAF712_008433 [Marasmius tenuissimus]|uniref:FAD-binding domain-containing protein n=1 Tax=Marasmius tenuissimus TaxID=585030 RepID=A0ABR2ZUZ7_9AGAR